MIRLNGFDFGTILEKMFVYIKDCFFWDSEFAQSVLSILKLILFTLIKDTDIAQRDGHSPQASIEKSTNLLNLSSNDAQNDSFMIGIQNLSNMLICNALRSSLWEDNKMNMNAMKGMMSNVTNLKHLKGVKQGLSVLTRGGVVSNDLIYIGWLSSL